MTLDKAHKHTLEGACAVCVRRYMEIAGKRRCNVITGVTAGMKSLAAEVWDFWTWWRSVAGWVESSGSPPLFSMRKDSGERPERNPVDLHAELAERIG